MKRPSTFLDVTPHSILTSRHLTPQARSWSYAARSILTSQLRLPPATGARPLRENNPNIFFKILIYFIESNVAFKYAYNY